jgi:hypothetical protein
VDAQDGLALPVLLVVEPHTVDGDLGDDGIVGGDVAGVNQASVSCLA